MNPLLAVQRAQEARRQHQQVEEALRASGAVHDGRGALPGDHRRLRGTPVLTKGVGGTMLGTDPLGALLRKEGRATKEST